MPAHLAERREKLRERYRAAAVEAHRHILAIASAGPSDAEAVRLLEAIEHADVVAASGDVEGALRLLEPLLAPLGSKSEGRGVDLERMRPRASAIVARTLARAGFAETYRMGQDGARGPALDRATRSFAQAEKLLAAGSFDEAEAAFLEVTAALERLAKDAGGTAQERLGEIRKRRGELVDEIRRLPARRFTKKQRDGALAAIRRLDAAVAAGDEPLARVAFDECRAFLDERRAERVSSAPAARPRSILEDDEPPPAPRPWGLIAATVVVLVAGGIGAWQLLERRAGREGALVTWSGPDTAIPGTEARPRSADAPSGEPRGASPVRPIPTLHAAELRRAEEISRARVRDAAGLEVASFEPSDRALRLTAGERRKLAAELRRGDPAILEWELDGRLVARGTKSLTLATERASEPGRRTIALVASVAGEREVLAAWEVEVESPIRFVRLEPEAGFVLAAPGRALDFRAEAATEPAEAITYRWTVDGETRGSAPEIALEVEDIGERRVVLETKAASGAVLRRSWRVIAARAASPDLVAEARSWVDEHCGALERRDATKLAALGEREALAALDSLAGRSSVRIDCSRLSAYELPNGLFVRFERTLRAEGESGEPLVQELPRLDRLLRKRDGRWIAAADAEA